MKHIFIIGSRGLPAKYGGFETFVDELVSHQESEQIQYHVACLSDTSHGQHTTYKGADCFTIKPPHIGAARVIAYDMMAISYALKMIREKGWKNPIVYILGNTIGAFIAPFAQRIHAVGGQLFVNPDGLEWKRSKWSKPVQLYLKHSEKLMSNYADLIVADNEGIEHYIQQVYPWSNTSFIAYGTDLTPSIMDSSHQAVKEFFGKWSICEKDYYLIVGRFVPENNYEVMIREFMKSQTKRDLIIICNHKGNAYFEQLNAETGFLADPRIKFVGTVYDKELLKYIRTQARAYLHGHEVGGTNPGLLEALAHTNENLILDVDFNRRVALDSAYYWNKQPGSLRSLLDQIDGQAEDMERGHVAKKRMENHYTWEGIVRQYEDLFLKWK